MTQSIKPAVLALAILAAAAPARGQEAPAFLPDLVRFAETLGAITYLDGLCGDPDAEVWRIKMQGVIEAQALEPADRRRTVDAYNRGYRSFANLHRVCTDHTRTVLDRYLAEGLIEADRIETRHGRGPSTPAAAATP